MIRVRRTYDWAASVVTSAQVLAKVGGKRTRWDMNRQFGSNGKITANGRTGFKKKFSGQIGCECQFWMIWG